MLYLMTMIGWRSRGARGRDEGRGRGQLPFLFVLLVLCGSAIPSLLYAQFTSIPTPPLETETSTAETETLAAELAESAPPSALDQARTLLSQGLIEQGFAQAQQIDLSLPVDHTLLAEVAGVAVEKSRLPLAIRLYERNLTAEEPFARQALLMLIDLELATNNAERARQYALQALRLGHLPNPAALLALSEHTLRTERYDETTQFLTLFAEQYSDQEVQDRYLWIKGQLLERDTVESDIELAILHYERLTAYYPLSLHWEAARSRARYLRRHFIDLR